MSEYDMEAIDALQQTIRLRGEENDNLRALNAELVEALRAAEELLVHQHMKTRPNAAFPGQINIARAAIAKAERNASETL